MSCNENVRLEILKIVREIAIEEFTERKLSAHTKWLSDSEKLWHNHRQILPYPIAPIYPNEDIILERARSLLEFVDSAEI